MQYHFTAAAQRVLQVAATWGTSADSAEISAPALLAGLLSEAECRPAQFLLDLGVAPASVLMRWPELRQHPRQPTTRLGWNIEVEAVLQRAQSERDQELLHDELTTTDLLIGLTDTQCDVAHWLQTQGITAATVAAGCETCHLAVPAQSPGPLAAEVELGHSQATLEHRVLDAAANRAREGLRVVEDLVRFGLEDAGLAGDLKALRHELTSALAAWPTASLLASRDSQGDVGAGLSTAGETTRTTIGDLLAANFHRAQEALRSLEEVAKLRGAGRIFEQFRYRVYTLEKAVETSRAGRQRLEGARLYVLCDGRDSDDALARLAAELIAAEVAVIQLRDKRLDDRTLLARARRLRQVTRGSGTLFIMNDRPDLARLSEADGVHVGQEELSVAQVRAIVGPEPLVGVSTHSLEQARQAIRDGANYLGVGPLFPSSTKDFAAYPGLAVLRQVLAEVSLPVFAIGGIKARNLDDVLASGADRVAVQAAVCDAADPAAAARELLLRLRSQSAVGSRQSAV